MKLIWLGYVFEIAILTLMNPFIVNFENIAFLAVIIHVLFTIIVLLCYRRKIKFVLLSAFIVRVVFLVWDLYGRDIFVLPNSGADSEMFYRTAISVSKQLSLLGETGGVYSDINGVLFYFIGPQRMFGQYMNVLLGLSTIYIIYKMLCILNIKEHVKRITLFITAFFPNSIIMSAIFLREAFPTFFVCLSLYYFVKWFKMDKLKFIVLSFLMLGIASMFHSGVIGIAVGYSFTFLFYSRELNIFKFSGRTIASFIIIIIIFSLSFTVFDSYIFGKFQNVEKIDDIYQTATANGMGGSAYLPGLQITNTLQLAVFGPIKSFYFLSSPLPMNWRGLMDVFTFFTDAMLYLGTILYFIKNRKKLGDRKALAISIVVMIIGAALIFGIGVSNTGTAVRHRQKIVPLFFVLLAIIMDKRNKT